MGSAPPHNAQPPTGAEPPRVHTELCSSCWTCVQERAHTHKSAAPPLQRLQPQHTRTYTDMHTRVPLQGATAAPTAAQAQPADTAARAHAPPTAVPQHAHAHVCTLMHMYVHVQPGLQPQSTRMDANGHARVCMYTYTHTEDHFPLSRLKLHPPQHTGPCHRGHTGDTRGTCWGRTGDTWGTCLSAELRSGTHKHTRGEIPLHPASCKHQGAPSPGARVTLVVPPPRCGTGEAPARFWLCQGSHQALPAAVLTGAFTCVWLLFRHGAAVVVLLCNFAHPHMWLLSPTGVVVLVWLCSHTCLSLYMSVAILIHAQSHGGTHV